MYGGTFHMLPEGWRVPSMTFAQFISMYLSGDQDNGVPPLCNVIVHHWKGHATQYRRVQSDMQYLMGHVKRVALESLAWKEENHRWSTGETLLLYEVVVGKFKFDSKSGGKRKRFNEFSWRTVVNLVRNHKGVLVGETHIPAEEDDEVMDLAEEVPDLAEEVPDLAAEV